MKTYILKYSVENNETFPIGTVVKITDNYWNKNGGDDKNTAFTVVKGKLKGKRGCVADGLDGFLFEDNAENRKIIDDFLKEKKSLKKAIKSLNKRWKELETVELS